MHLVGFTIEITCTCSTHRYFTLYEHKLMDENRRKDLPAQNINLCRLKRLVTKRPRFDSRPVHIFDGQSGKEKGFFKEEFGFPLTVSFHQ